MSALATAVASAATSGVTDDIRTVAGLASLTLGLIGFFTNLRVNAQRGKAVQALSWKTVWEAMPEIVLLLIALVALIAMAPLLDAFQLAQIGRRAGALPTMFALIWLGFLAIAAIELWLIGTRLHRACKNRKARQKPVNGVA